MGVAGPTPSRPCRFRALVAFAVTNEDLAAALIEIGFGEIERFSDAKARAPEHGDRAAHPVALRARAGLAHDRNNLLNARRISRVVQALVARRTTSVIAGHRSR